jgi:hypothetical protein
VLLHVCLLELLDERLDTLIMRSFRWKFNALGAEFAVQGTEIGCMRYVEEVDAFLQGVGVSLAQANTHIAHMRY